MAGVAVGIIGRKTRITLTVTTAVCLTDTDGISIRILLQYIKNIIKNVLIGFFAAQTRVCRRSHADRSGCDHRKRMTCMNARTAELHLGEIAVKLSASDGTADDNGNLNILAVCKTEAVIGGDIFIFRCVQTAAEVLVDEMVNTVLCAGITAACDKDLAVFVNIDYKALVGQCCSVDLTVCLAVCKTDDDLVVDSRCLVCDNG